MSKGKLIGIIVVLVIVAVVVVGQLGLCPCDGGCPLSGLCKNNETVAEKVGGM